MIEPTTPREKLKLKRTPRRRWIRPVYAVLGLALLLFLGYISFPFLSGSGARDLAVESTVGSDLLVAGPGRSGTESAPGERPGVTRSNRGGENEFIDLTSYQMEKVVPRRKQPSLTFDQTEKLEYGHHTVRQGENLWSIANQYGLKTYTIVSTNFERLRSVDHLPVGVKLRIPNRNGILTTLKPGQTLWDLKQSYNVSHRRILAFNKLSSPKYLHKGESIFIPGARPVNPYKYRLFHGGKQPFTWPVSPARRRVTSGFGNRVHPIRGRKMLHRGIDIGAKRGTAVFASRAGTVKFSGRIKGYGRVITIKHSRGYKTLYAHLGRSFVSRGQYVEQGQHIGEIGSSGLATGANLHFEIRRETRALDPIHKLP